MADSITVKGKQIISGQMPLICAPVIGKTKGELLEEIKNASNILPDCIEWRADYYHDIDNSVETLCEVREIIPETPVIFTLRIQSEGGFKYIDQQKRLQIINRIICSGQADIVDIELCNGQDFIDSVLETAKENGIYTIISSHNFQNTPDKDDMIKILCREQDAGADIVKLAVMPTCSNDVLALLEATNIFTKHFASVPAITVSMDRLGVISRLGGGVFGSVLTFGSISRPSAPGQVSVEELKGAFKLIYS